MAIEHKDIPNVGIHEPKGADTATAGQVYISDGLGSGEWTNALTNPSNILIERLLDGSSSSLTQNPSGTGVANKIQVEFGPAVGDLTDAVSLDALGTVSLNTAGTYRIKVSMQFGRVGGAGASQILFRVCDADSGIQLGSSVTTRLDDADSTQYFENDTWLTVPADTKFCFEIMRDAAGNDSGGLIGSAPTVDGGNEWNSAPSASIRIERWTS